MTTGPVQRSEGSSYGQILKSSALIGGSSAVVIAIGIVRTKLMAVLLGPAGYGLMSMYTSILDLSVSVAGLGVNSSGVRQIAEAVSTGDQGRIARTIYVLRRTSVLLGLAGAALLFVFAGHVSTVTFGDARYELPIRLLAVGVFFRLISLSQSALLQGMRRIRDMAIVSVAGAFLGSVVAVAAVYAMGVEAVAAAAVAFAVVGFFMSWFYARKVPVEHWSGRQASEVRSEVGSLLKLGMAFMASGLLMMGAGYVVRTMVLRLQGLDMAGLYQAAWALGGMYIGIILQAMGSDFYPRLTGAIRDNVETNRLVNEQAEVSLLLAAPGVIATLTVAPLLMTLFYSSKFAAASELLRWICLGMALRVVTWPMGFIIVARGEQTIFFLTELAWAGVNVGLSWICLNYFGLNGAGIAFLGSYLFHWFLIYPIVRRLTGFRWSSQNAKGILLFVVSIAAIFTAFEVLPADVATIVGVIAAIAASLYSLRSLLRLVSVVKLPRPIARVLAAWRG